MENDLIQADCVEATEFPELSERYQVYAVPRTVINDSSYIEGSLPEETFLDHILETLTPPADDAK